VGGLRSKWCAFSLVPCREGGGRVDALSAGRSIQCGLQDAAHVQSRAGIVVVYGVVGGIDGVRVRVCRLVS
jgi:hypothetical protein